MNNIGIVLYFFADNHLIRSANGGIRQKWLENFLWCCLNFGSGIKDILLTVDCYCQLVIVVREWFVSFLSLKVKEIIIWMIGSVIRLLFFPCLKGEKEGKWGKRGWESLFFITFFNFIHSKINKKIGFRGSAFPFPPFSLLRTGRRKENNIKYRI